MEESAVQQEKMEGSQERRDDGGKAGWKNECSLSSLLKHSCFLCWSSPRDTDILETDDRVLAKAAEIRELENAVAVESLELQEQQSDRKELEETLDKLEQHKEKLVQQIKTTRQLCYEESQQILSLQAEEAQKESQVEEYERELARARWRLRRLREEVKQAKRRAEEAGERNTPLQDSIRQSYEEILQEENTLCSLSGGMVTPQSQLEESASPADTTEDDPLPMKPWGRSQSLPAYADLIMGANGLSFCNNLAGTREENDSGTSSPKDMDRSDIDEDPEEGDNEGEKDGGQDPSPLQPDPASQLDFYQDNPFTHCHADHDLFNEDLFLKTDSSDGFASDPFKGSNPFAADVLFPEAEEGVGTAGDEADTSLSCAENKASTGTQCFESEFPDEDSDIEISYSREDLDAIAEDSRGFKPIQSSSEELAPEPMQGWRSQGQHSVESDPNGYELDLGPVSPPSDIEERSLGSLAEETFTTMTGLHGGLSSGSAPAIPERRDHAPLETGGVEPGLPHHLTSSKAAEWAGNVEEEPQNPATPQNSLDSQNLVVQPDSSQNSFELSYEPASQSSCDPYGFKLSPEHSSHTLLDPDEAELSPEPADNVLSFDPEPSSSQPHELNFDPYGFDITASQVGRDSDPYGFKLSGEEENQEVLDLCGHHDLGVLGLCTSDNNDQAENSNYNQEPLKPLDYENQEVLEHFPADFQEMVEPPETDNREVVYTENQELLDFSSHDNQEMVESGPDVSRDEVLEPGNYENQEVLEPYSRGRQEMLDFSHHENQQVLDSDCHGNQELLDFCSKENQEVLVPDMHNNQKLQDLRSSENQELVDLCSYDNQEVLDLLGKDSKSEANNNQPTIDPDSSTNNSSDSDLASEDLEGPGRHAATTNTTNFPSMAPRTTSAIQDFNITAAPKCHGLLEGDLGSVFGAGGYVGCPDVADDLEPLVRKQEKPAAEPTQPVRPVRPPRPSLRAKEKGIDLK